jgi:hypothetical protein
MKYMDKAKAIYFDLQRHEGNMVYIDAINIVETLLVAVAILNGAYIKKGIKRIENEVARLSMVPAGLLENFRKLTRTNDKAKIQLILNELIVETDKIWISKFDPDKNNVDSSELAGFYEEFKSTYNKLLLACDEKNYENAYYAGFMIDRETQSFLSSYTGPAVFPIILNKVLMNEFETVRASCLEHERQLIKLLNQNGIEINTFMTINEFGHYWLEKAI